MAKQLLSLYSPALYKGYTNLLTCKAEQARHTVLDNHCGVESRVEGCAVQDQAWSSIVSVQHGMRQSQAGTFVYQGALVS